MDVKLEWREGILVAWMEGDLDAGAGQKIEEEFSNVVEQRPKGVILNFSKAKFVSSLGISMVIQLQRDLKAIGSQLQIVGVQPSVRLVLSTCNLDKVVPMDHTLESAIRILNGVSANLVCR